MKISLVTALALLISFPSFAKSSSYTKALKRKSANSTETMSTEIEEASVSEEKGLMIEGSLVRGDLGLAQGDSDGGVEVEGVNLGWGKIYGIANYVEGSTSLGFKLLQISRDDIEDNWRFTDVSINQKFSIVTQITEDIKFKPFISGGFGRGFMEIQLRDVDSENSVNLDLTNNYIAIAYGGGIDFEFSGGITPFIKYEVSRLNMDSTADVDGTVNGVTVNESGPSDFDDLRTESLMIGLGYRF